MELKVDNERVLMSEALRGQVPELDGGDPEFRRELMQKVVTVIAERRVGDKATAMVGVLRGVLLGSEPEIEFRCDLTEAMDVLEAQQLTFGSFELHYGERVVQIKGPFVVKAARLDEITLDDPLCTLGLHLARLRASA